MFGTQATRLLRAHWADAKQLAEELYAMFQNSVPLSHDAPITITSTKSIAPLTLRSFGDTTQVINIEGPNGEAGTVTITNEGATIDNSTTSTTTETTTTTEEGESVQRVFVGVVQSKGVGQNYTVDLYGNGLGSASTGTVTARALNLDASEELPADSEMIVVRMANDTYYMQPPYYVE